MGQGMQVFDANGALVVDINDSISKIIGQFVMQAETPGAVTVPELAGGSRIFVFKQAQPPLGINGVNRGRAQITISGRTISWTAGRETVWVYYGVY